MAIPHRFLPLGLIALAACTTPTAPAPPVAASPASPVAGQCNADAARAHIGKVATAATVDAARRDAGANIARTLKPGQMVTMEYLEGRLNIDVDAANVIINVRCG